jgi:hypothetical protein
MSDAESDDGGGVLGAAPVAPVNVAAMERALEDIKQTLPWIERVVITSDKRIDAPADDDLKRETALYGLCGVRCHSTRYPVVVLFHSCALATR